MVDDAVTFVAVLLWLTAAAEGVHVARRREPEPALTMLLVTFILLALSATFFVPAVHLAAGRLTGVPNISEPLARTALLGAAWSAPALLLWLTDAVTAPRRVRRRAVALGVFVVLLWTLFALTPAQRPTRMFARDYAADVVVAAYLMTSLTYLAFALVDVLRGSLRYTRIATGPLFTALRLIAAGCLLGLGYVAVTALFVLFLVTGHRPEHSRLESSVGRLLAVSGGLFVIAGSAYPPLVSGLTRIRNLWRTYRSLRRLYPLWSLLHQANPDLALAPPSSALADAVAIGDTQLRLYRRVIEIRDGRLALAAYFDPALVSATRDEALQSGQPPAEAAARAEATALLDALRHQQAGRPARGPAPPPPDNSTTLDEEVDWLSRVARHLHHLTGRTDPLQPERPTPTIPRTTP
jgi:hypothetical protein